MERAVAIVGYMGSGKSTVGRLLARKLGREFVDLDESVARRAGCAIPEIFEKCGEAGFRELEHQELSVMLDGDRVVACGGGVVLRDDNRGHLARSAATVFLEEDVGLLFTRTRGEGRPLRDATLGEFERRYADRLPLYREVADRTVAVRGRSPEAVAEEIARWLNA